MSTQEFNCPNCGAPLDYPGTGATVRCPYCETSVVVPVEMRGPAQPARPAEPPLVISLSQQETYTVRQETPVTPARPPTVVSKQGRNLSCLLIGIVAALLLFAGVMAAFPLIITNKTTDLVNQAINPVRAQTTDIPASEMEIPTLFELASPTPVPSPIPFANLVASFGSEGIGPGLLNRAEYIAVDGAGMVYVADYEDGRIQVFDAEGNYQSGWQVGDANTIIYGMTVTHEGILYVAYGGDIYRYNGAKGALLDKIDYANGQEFGDLALLPNGGVLGVWYEGRWGIITSLQGHRDDLVWFDADGNTVQTLESAISGQTGSLALDTSVAVDGLGTVYALSSFDGAVFKFSSKGKFIDRFDYQGSGGQDGRCIAVDGQGRVYVGGSRQVSIFTPEGSFIRSFDTEASIYKMAFSEQGDLYLISGDTVSRYTLGELP